VGAHDSEADQVSRRCRPPRRRRAWGLGRGLGWDGRYNRRAFFSDAFALGRQLPFRRTTPLFTRYARAGISVSESGRWIGCNQQIV